MNRLWVRLSLVMMAIILVFTLLPIFGFLLFPRESFARPRREPDRPVVNRPFANPWRDVPVDVIRSVLLAGGIGIVGGVAASWLLAAPITKLAKAAEKIGTGDLSARVNIKSGSREIDGLAHSFNKMADDLQRAAEIRSNLMADVSHELRTPLTVLEGNLRAALDHVYELDDEQIANLYEQTRHLIHLVSELRELTLAEAAQLPLELQPVDLAILVQETVAVFQPLADEKQIKLASTLSGSLPLVRVDRQRIRQVLHNLFANALRHTPANGQITIHGSSDAGEVQVTVRDSGEGIDPQHLHQIFDRFYRADPSRSRETGGSGLGLAIVKAIVEAHQGSVSASSSGIGRGSAFTIALPTSAG